MVEDEPDGDVQKAGGGVVDKPEGFEVKGVDSVAPGRRARGGTGGGFPSLQHSLSIVLGLGRWDTVAATNLVSCAVVPTSSIYGTARRGLPAVYWAERPRSGRESMAQLPLGQLVEIDTNTS